MAGGIGSRFWPSSTADRPKQFLDILGVGKSLLRMTFERCLTLVPAENIIIVTNKRYLHLVQEHLPELPVQNILCEPSMNNTAPCVAYTALRIQSMDKEAVFAVLPSDHVILKEEKYTELLNQAFDYAAQNDALVTLGIQPTRPDTGYGYIKYSKSPVGDLIQAYKVEEFKEKPDLITAQKYVDSGDYLWNAGMFVWSVKNIIQAFRLNAPNILEVLTQDTSHYNTDTEQEYIDAVYPLTQKISIDYAIMERANNVYTLPADIGWSDLGTWNSLHAYLANEGSQIKIGKNIHLIDSEDVIIMSNNDKTLVIKGLKDFIVVDENNALLIYPKKDEQEIKSVVEQLPK